MDKRIRKICFGALFAALCAAATFISVPLPFGYFNLGDVAVLMSGLLLGGATGALAAGVGSALADVFMGYSVYAPATFIIKALVSLTASYLCVRASRHSVKNDNFLVRGAIFILSEIIMVGGYFAFESIILGYGLGATASIFGNAMQGVSCSVIATLLMSLIKKSKIDRFFSQN